MVDWSSEFWIIQKVNEMSERIKPANDWYYVLQPGFHTGSASGQSVWR